MSADEFKELCDFERKLKVGDKCLAYWTNSGIYWRAEVKVKAINKKSYQVEIVGDVVPAGVSGMTYPVGQKLNIPNTLNYDRWTWNNRVAPLEQKNKSEGGQQNARD